MTQCRDSIFYPKTLEQLDVYISSTQAELRDCAALEAYLDANPRESAIRLRARADQVFSGYVRGFYAKRPAADVRAGVLAAIEHTRERLTPALATYLKDRAALVAQAEADAQRHATADRLHAVLARWLETHSGELSERNLGCLRMLIEEGDIRDETELAKYGVTLEGRDHP